MGLLITAMLASVAVCCGVLNLFLHAGRAWSLYVIGAAAMLWLWLVPPLLARGCTCFSGWRWASGRCSCTST